MSVLNINGCKMAKTTRRTEKYGTQRKTLVKGREMY